MGSCDRANSVNSVELYSSRKLISELYVEIRVFDSYFLLLVAVPSDHPAFHNRPFLSWLLPLCQNQFSYKTIPMKLCSA